MIEIGNTSQCDIVASLEDYILENDEVFEVNVSSLPSVIVETTTALIHIGNDDGKIRCYIRVSVHRSQNAHMYLCNNVFLFTYFICY